MSAFNSNLWIVNLITFVFNTFFTFTSLTGWYGKTNQAVSDEYPTLITPQGYAFSIWSLIFMGEGALVVFQCLPSYRQYEPLVKGVWIWFTSANVWQTLWTFAFAQEQFVLSAVLLVSIFVSLVAALRGLAPFRKTIGYGWQDILKFGVVAVPLGIHGGWVCAASLVNVNLALNFHGLSLAGQVAAAVIAAFLASGTAMYMSAAYGSVSFSAAVVWALVAIYAKPEARQQQLGSVTAEGLGASLLIVAMLAALVAVGEVVRSAAVGFGCSSVSTTQQQQGVGEGEGGEGQPIQYTVA